MRRNCFFSPLENSTKSRNATCYKHVWRARARRSRVVVYISPYCSFLHHTSLTRRLFSFFSPHFARNISLCTIVVTTRIISSNPSDDCVKFKTRAWNRVTLKFTLFAWTKFDSSTNQRQVFCCFILTQVWVSYFLSYTAAVLLAFEIREGLSRYITSFAI